MAQATHGKERLALLGLCSKPRLPRTVWDSPPSTSLANPEQEPLDAPHPLGQGSVPLLPLAPVGFILHQTEQVWGSRSELPHHGTNR